MGISRWKCEERETETERERDVERSGGCSGNQSRRLRLCGRKWQKLRLTVAEQRTAAVDRGVGVGTWDLACVKIYGHGRCAGSKNRESAKIRTGRQREAAPGHKVKVAEVGERKEVAERKAALVVKRTAFGPKSKTRPLSGRHMGGLWVRPPWTLSLTLSHPDPQNP